MKMSDVVHGEELAEGEGSITLAEEQTMHRTERKRNGGDCSNAVGSSIVRVRSFVGLIERCCR